MKGFLKSLIEFILVNLQFLIIILHFIKWEIIPQKEIMQVKAIFVFVGFSIIIISSIIMLMAIKELGINLSPLPRPKANSNLVISGIYRYMRHPMYYSLLFISFGFFITKLSFYHLSLTISLLFIIKLKIILEEKYLIKKFKNYSLYIEKVKY